MLRRAIEMVRAPAHGSQPPRGLTDDRPAAAPEPGGSVPVHAAPATSVTSAPDGDLDESEILLRRAIEMIQGPARRSRPNADLADDKASPLAEDVDSGSIHSAFSQSASDDQQRPRRDRDPAQARKRDGQRSGNSLSIGKRPHRRQAIGATHRRNPSGPAGELLRCNGHPIRVDSPAPPGRRPPACYVRTDWMAGGRCRSGGREGLMPGPPSNVPPSPSPAPKKRDKPLQSWAASSFAFPSDAENRSSGTLRTTSLRLRKS